MSCQQCRFSVSGWFADSTQSYPRIGYLCKRYPPAAISEVNGNANYSRMKTCWPIVDGDDWCGEFAADAAKADDEL